MDPTNHPAAEFLRGRASRFLAPLLDPVADLILMAMRPMTRHCAVMAVALSMAWAGGGHRVEADAAETMGESVLDLRENHISEGFGRHIYIILYTPLDDSTFNTSIFSLFFSCGRHADDRNLARIPGERRGSDSKALGRNDHRSSLDRLDLRRESYPPDEKKPLGPGSLDLFMKGKPVI